MLYATSSRTVTATFTRDDTPDTPDEVVARILTPSDDASSYEMGVDDELVTVSEGVFQIEVDCTEPGWWTVRFEGTWDDGSSAPSYKSTEERWYVRRSAFPDAGS